jgi:vacuolar protein sorting-associated protein 13A/C
MNPIATHSISPRVVIRNPIAVVINSITMALGNVNEAPLQLNALGIKDARMSTAIIVDRIFFHYRQEVLRQLYRILGSVDFLGNPASIYPLGSYFALTFCLMQGWVVHERQLWYR